MSNQHYNYICVERLETKDGERFVINWQKTTGFDKPECGKDTFLTYNEAQKWAYYYGIPRCTVTSLIGGNRYSTLIRGNPIKDWSKDQYSEVVHDSLIKAEEGVTYISSAPPSRKRQRSDVPGETTESVKKEQKLDCDEELTAWTKAATQPISDVYTQADCE